VPFTVGAVAGPVVYPRSPLIVVPPVVFVYVLERMPNDSAIPREGVVAALTNVARPIITISASTTTEAVMGSFINMVTGFQYGSPD